FVDQTESRAAEDFARLNSAFLAGDKDVGASLALGEEQVAVFLNYERRPERYDEHHTEHSTRGGEQENVPVVELEAEKDERRQGEGDAGGNRLARRAHRLHHVVLEDRRFAQPLEDAD